MSLSKKNLDKLNNLLKNKKTFKDNKISRNIDKTNKPHKNLSKPEDPSQIFYSLIDNSKTLNETSDRNHLLRESEKDFFNINSKKTNSLKNLSSEDELYDEFNYLLEE